MKARMTERKRVEIVNKAINKEYGDHLILEIRTNPDKPKEYELLAVCMDENKPHSIGRFKASVHGDIVKVMKMAELVEKVYVDVQHYVEVEE